MEVKLDKRYPVAASVEQAWAVLADIRATAACMPGAQITEQLDDTHFKGTVKSKIGPASMTFNGDIELQALDAASQTMQMLGKGADKAGSSAQMTLSAGVEAGEAPGTSVLVGQASIVVSGKLAQFGSRLLVPVSDAMLAQFAQNFSATAAAVVVGAQAAAAPPADATAAPPTAPVDTPAPTADGAPVAPAEAAAPAAVLPAAPAPAAPATPGRPVAVVPPPPVKELNALGLLWTVFKGWLAGLLGRK
jgi:carbon monoxide dehydrogenase subunit G